ncbi:YkgJ family cysteine cluster protein [Mesobacterium sp. TK19101]|uniref:YkgJ family cysteine cluster protein n=1 Tax=Mesobacterium hydrothermale TaxID=3111907 RepID=A0ABU6HJB2_9RHOB|nr:YkgJ family cysteine cluster protein [Mesobacterium sp. TK19101]MEC3862544.1 YkgJ family cysteine cluster protein [Mesobacterium sp. TK19101]
MTPSEFDCIRCGACCFGTHAKYIALLPEDRDRAIPDSATTSVDGKRYMSMCGGHCTQLTRTAGAELVCAIYNRRPEACRAFRAGSFECRKARQHRIHLADAMRLPVTIPPAMPPQPEPLVVAQETTPAPVFGAAWGAPDRAGA